MTSARTTVRDLGRRAGGRGPRAAAGPPGHRGDRAGEARRLPSRLPRRHRAPDDAAGARRARADGGVRRDRARADGVGGVRDDRRPARAADLPSVARAEPASATSRSCRSGTSSTCSRGPGGRTPAFTLVLGAEVTAVLQDERGVAACGTAGGRSSTRCGPPSRSAADGRRSVLRATLGSAVRVLSTPVDVLWYPGRPAPPRAGGPARMIGQRRPGVGEPRRLVAGRAAGAGGARRPHPRRGLPRSASVSADGAVDGRPGRRIDHWDAVKLLTVAVERLRRWSAPGLLAIGDAAQHDVADRSEWAFELAVADAVTAARTCSAPRCGGRSAAAAPTRWCRPGCCGACSVGGCRSRR